MTRSAFGVETGRVSKGRFTVRVRRPKAPEPVKLDFKPIKPGVTPSGPGSMRGRMDPSAHETRLAAERRRDLGKGLLRDLAHEAQGLKPVAHTLKTTTGHGDRLTRDTVRPATWAAKGKHTSRHTYPALTGPEIYSSRTVVGGGLTRAGGVAATAAGAAATAGGVKTRRRQLGKSAFGVDT